MQANLILATIFSVIAIVGVIGLRRFHERIRLFFDAICFVAVSVYLLSRGTFPVFPPLNSAADSAALLLRVVGGAWWLLGSRLLVMGIWFIHSRDRRSRETRLFFELSTAAIYIATALIVLKSVFSLPVAGIVATSGVVAIVLGLALQNTLADVFAGIAVGIEAPFREGDHIQIDERIEGKVVQVNWRSIRILTDGDDIAIVPNSLIAKAEIINRSSPSQRRAAFLDLTCPNEAVPERVIEMLVAATMLCPDILRIPAPGAALTRVGARRSTYRVSFSVESAKHLSATKDLLLRSARRQLHYGGFLNSKTSQESPSDGSGREVMLQRRLLGDAVLFECLTEPQLDELALRLQSLRLEPGEQLFVQGSTDACLYIIASGILEFTRHSGTVSETLGYMGAGEYVGEIGLLTGEPHAATAVANTHCCVYWLERDAIAPLLTKNAQLAAAFDKSVRHGLEVLGRGVATKVTPSIGTKGQLLLRIRSIFHFHSA
jgi:small-conductance mechanosensitive channel